MAYRLTCPRLHPRSSATNCQQLGITPDQIELPGDIDPYAYVWSLNGEHRDLADDQRYLIWKACSDKSEGWKKEQKRIRDAANARQAQAMEGRPYAPKGQKRSAEKEVAQVAQPPSPKVAVTREAKAAASKTNRGTVERMDQLAGSGRQNRSS